MDKFYEAISQLDNNFYNCLKLVPSSLANKITEIRIRACRPIVLKTANSSYFLKKDGSFSTNYQNNVLIATAKDISNSIDKMCNYSIYSYQDQIKSGYVTLKGGHRVGICGTAVFNETELINVKNITSMNVRIARDINFYNEDTLKIINNDYKGILLVGPPSSGKTTLLRFIAKSLSLKLLSVTVVDERMEIANDEPNLGFCDILSGFLKPDGIMQAIRALAPDVIVCDEIGTKEDIKAIKYGVNSGVKFIVSIHAGSLNELIKRPQGKALLETAAFDKIVFLKDKITPGKILNIISWPNKEQLSLRIADNNIEATAGNF